MEGASSTRQGRTGAQVSPTGPGGSTAGARISPPHPPAPRGLGARTMALTRVKPTQGTLPQSRKTPPPIAAGGAVVEEKARAWGWEFSYEDMATEVEALGFRVSPSTIRRNLDNDEWRAMQMRVLPMLNEEHREKRLAYANEHQGDDWYCEVDLDEKWVYSVHTHALLKLPPDDPVPV